MLLDLYEKLEKGILLNGLRGGDNVTRAIGHLEDLIEKLEAHETINKEATVGELKSILSTLKQAKSQIDSLLY